MTGENRPDHRLGGLFVDFENIAIPLMNEYGFSRAEALAKVLRIIGNVQGHLKEMNVEVVSRHAFADWSQYPEVQGELYRMGVRTQNVASTIHKNSADIELSLSVLETLLTRKDIETLLVISGDRDYMPITMRAKENGRNLMFASFKESLSGDLKGLVGQDGYFYVDPQTERITLPEEAEMESTTPRQAKIKAPGDLTSDEIIALRAALAAFDQYKERFGDVRLSVFLKEGLAEALPSLSHLQRKDVLNSIIEKGLLQYSQKPDNMGGSFPVFSVNEESPVVKSVRKGGQAGRDLLVKAVKSVVNQDGLVLGGSLGLVLRDMPGWPEDYGARKLADFISMYPDVLRKTGTYSGEDVVYQTDLRRDES